MAPSGLSVDSFSEQPPGISFNLFQKDNSYHRPDENLVRDIWSATADSPSAGEGEFSLGRVVLSLDVSIYK